MEKGRLIPLCLVSSTAGMLEKANDSPGDHHLDLLSAK